jgi:Skp family chaperone for outer membrane proteins
MTTFVVTALCLGLSSSYAQVQPRATAPASAVPAGTRVAVIDINFIFKKHVRFKQTMDSIKQEIEDFEGVLREERNRITTKTEQLQALPTGSPGYKQLEEEVAAMHTALGLKTGRKRKEILEREAKVYYNSYKNIEQHVRQFADRYGIDLVMRFNSEPMDATKRESVLQGINRAVVYQRNLNITNQIIEILNRQTPRLSGNTNGPSIPGR